MVDHYYHQYSPEKKRALKALLIRHHEQFKAQRDIFERSLMKALRDRIRLRDEVLKGTIPIEAYRVRVKATSDYIKAFLNGGTKQ